MTATTRRRAATEAEAAAALQDEGLTDGLPVVVPTPARVERMVLASGLDGDIVLGTVGPDQGQATVEKVAVNAVMAGCEPDHFPVVVAAVRAAVAPELDLAEMQGTTHGVAPMIVVNGPARHACGVVSGYGAIGPGHRANATIGRALRLVLMNLGGARPGMGDLALLGHGGKFTACLAEAEEDSPFTPLHVSRGMAPEQSAVTVVACEPPHSGIVFPAADGSPLSLADRILTVLAALMSSVAANNVYFARGTMAVLLNPDHARVLADAGYDREGVARALFERAGNRRDALRALAGPVVPPGEDDDVLPVVARPEDLVLVVAGAGGNYSFVAPGWAAGAHGNMPVTIEIELSQACAI